MGYRYDEFAPGEIYHVFTRGVAQKDIFLADTDRQRFLELLAYYLPQETPVSFSTAVKLKRKLSIKTNSGEGFVDVICYCLMDNHVHALLLENTAGGISTYMRRVLNAYARYFNLKQHRSGPLFLHPFKAVLVNADEQLLHTSRYIHLNPYAAGMINDPFAYPWSSLAEYITPRENTRCHTSLLRSMMEQTEYADFVTDQADYLASLADNNHLLIDNDGYTA